MVSAIGATHYSLYRALLGLYLALHFAMLLPFGAEVFAAGGAVAHGGLIPLFGVLPNPLALDDGPAMVTALLGLGVLCGVALFVGWSDRIGAVTAALVLGWLFQRNPLIANPTLPLLGWLLVLHAFVPPRAPGSLMGVLRGADPDWRFPAHLHLAAWIVLALSYSFSGWTKLPSPSWVEGDAIRLVLENPLARDHAARLWVLATPPALLVALTWALMLLELLFAPLALVRATRPWAWLGMLVAQFGFLAFLDFADLTLPMLLVHLLTFDPAWLRRWECTAPAILLFDGDCAFCHALIRVAMREDAHRRLRFAPLGGPTARRCVSPDALHAIGDSIVLVDDRGRISQKSRAVAGVLERLGGGWLLLAWTLRCVPRVIADVGYDVVGHCRHRLGLLRTVDACVIAARSGDRILP